MRDIVLETRLVGDIHGSFYVASYQRGYRWGVEEVKRLLNDVYTSCSQNDSSQYYIQPIVLRNNGKVYELIDGQQRLTTIYLIYKYLHQAKPYLFDPPKFSLCFETRDKTKEFLLNIDSARKEENIDYWYICNAYQAISEWFSNKEEALLDEINSIFKSKVKVIWYEVDQSEDAINLFTRLNIGKIPLTSAELVKAMLLCRKAVKQANGQQKFSITRERQEEIALLWDNIENELNDNSLWYFLTNKQAHNYQTRIDLVLDIIADTPKGNREKYFTYFEFEKMRTDLSLEELWNKIQSTFLTLKGWYEDSDFYHKIGYLIASETKDISEIFRLSREKTKSQFKEGLDEYIKDSIRLSDDTKNYLELSYEKHSEYAKISRLLLLFNVVSVSKTQRFPFDIFNNESNNNASWSLEHIHAQQSEGLHTEDAYKSWLTLHLKSLERLDKTDINLINKVKSALEKKSLGSTEFKNLQTEVSDYLSPKEDQEYFMHSLSNLALLNTRNNAALNNSTFDVKRNAIIEMDKRGDYIPFCTKMVFLKYYSKSENNQLHFWSKDDRKAYIKCIKETLGKYLENPIEIEEA